MLQSMRLSNVDVSPLLVTPSATAASITHTTTNPRLAFPEKYDGSPLYTPLTRVASHLCELLLALHQGKQTAAEYALTFRTLAAQTTWVDDTLKLLFRKGLNMELQSELACRGRERH